VNSHQIEISNPDKVLYPDDGYTKRDVIEYYHGVAEVLVPYLRERPLTLHRFPDGITKSGFYQKAAPDYSPEWLERVKVTKREGGSITHIICSDAATLVYLANQACISLHPWLSRSDMPEKPDRIIFDFDPSEESESKESFKLVREGAVQTRDVLEEQLGLKSWLMTTGSRGLHVVVPLRRYHSHDVVQEAARTIANLVRSMDSKNFTTEIRKSRREGRTFIDTARNAYAQTAVAPYSLRALKGAPVATPIEWSELDSSMSPQKYNLSNIRERISSRDNPWSDMKPQRLSMEKVAKMPSKSDQDEE
jgi:bifunctional non-homologous end joining protein LigD